MRRGRGIRMSAIGLSAGVVFASALVATAPASAAPGDASAVGVAADVDASIAGLVDLTTNATVGDVAVAGSGNDGFTDADGTTLVDAAIADITVGAVTTAVSSTPTGSTASSQIAGANVTLFGTNVLTADAATATATCPVGDTPTSDASLTGLTLFGTAATLDADTPTVSVSAALDGDLLGVTATVDASRVVTTTATSATATAVLATVTLNGAVGAVTLVDDTVATVVLARAACETPAAATAVFAATGITPNSGPTTGGQTVTISGTGFDDGTTVSFAGTPATAVTVSPDGTSLTAVTPTGPAGATTAVVSNGTTEQSLPYTYVAPTVSGFTPEHGPEAGGTPITISGTGLQAATGVTIGGTPADVQSVSPDGTQIVVTTPAGTGSADVIVGFPGGVTVTAPEQFVYDAPVPATITGVSPAAGPVAGGQQIVLTGTGLGDVTDVTVGGAPATIVGTPTDTSITVVTPAGTAGAADIAVTDASGTTTADDAYTYVAPPTVTGEDPESGSTAGGTPVTVIGSGFVSGATTVTICGITIPASEVVVNADGTRLVFTAPACAAGTTTFTVTTAGGTTDAAAFRYVTPATTASAADAANGASTGALAYTGGTALPAGLAGFGLLAAGMAAAIGAYRRRLR